MSSSSELPLSRRMTTDSSNIALLQQQTSAMVPTTRPTTTATTVMCWMPVAAMMIVAAVWLLVILPWLQDVVWEWRIQRHLRLYPGTQMMMKQSPYRKRKQRASLLLHHPRLQRILDSGRKRVVNRVRQVMMAYTMDVGWRTHSVVYLWPKAKDWIMFLLLDLCLSRIPQGIWTFASIVATQLWTWLSQTVAAAAAAVAAANVLVSGEAKGKEEPSGSSSGTGAAASSRSRQSLAPPGGGVLRRNLSNTTMTTTTTTTPNSTVLPAQRRRTKVSFSQHSDGTVRSAMKFYNPAAEPNSSMIQNNHHDAAQEGQSTSPSLSPLQPQNLISVASRIATPGLRFMQQRRHQEPAAAAAPHFVDTMNAPALSLAAEAQHTTPPSQSSSSSSPNVLISVARRVPTPGIRFAQTETRSHTEATPTAAASTTVQHDPALAATRVPPQTAAAAAAASQQSLRHGVKRDFDDSVLSPDGEDKENANSSLGGGRTAGAARVVRFSPAQQQQQRQVRAKTTPTASPSMIPLSVQIRKRRSEAVAAKSNKSGDGDDDDLSFIMSRCSHNKRMRPSFNSNNSSSSSHPTKSNDNATIPLGQQQQQPPQQVAPLPMRSGRPALVLRGGNHPTLFRPRRRSAYHMMDAAARVRKEREALVWEQMNRQLQQQQETGVGTSALAPAVSITASSFGGSSNITTTAPTKSVAASQQDSTNAAAATTTTTTTTCNVAAAAAADGGGGEAPKQHPSFQFGGGGGAPSAIAGTSSEAAPAVAIQPTTSSTATTHMPLNGTAPAVPQQEPEKKPTFQFGAATVNTPHQPGSDQQQPQYQHPPTTTPPAFSFGAATPANTPQPGPVAAAPAAPTPAATAIAAPSSFAFGSTPANTTAPAAAATPSFTFGSTPANNTPAAAAAVPGFTSTAPPQQQEQPKPRAVYFGATVSGGPTFAPAPTAQQQQQQPSFAFGAAAAATPATAPTFGGGTFPTTAAAAAPPSSSQQQQPTFAFGTSSSAAPTPQQAPTIQFGATGMQQQPAGGGGYPLRPSTGPSFGASTGVPAFGTAPAAAQAQPPMSGGFAMGSVPPTSGDNSSSARRRAARHKRR